MPLTLNIITMKTARLYEKWYFYLLVKHRHENVCGAYGLVCFLVVFKIDPRPKPTFSKFTHKKLVVRVC